jgi:hypothetical protein
MDHQNRDALVAMGEGTALVLLQRGLVLLVAALSFLAPSSVLGQSDGRTNVNAGLRDESQQAVRVHLYSEPGHCLRVVSAGVQTRNADPSPQTAIGSIALPAGPAAGNIVWAGLYWVILGNSAPSNSVTLNGVAVSPIQLGVTGSPCWPERYAYAYVADVTSLVAAGANTVAGLDDSGVLARAFESDGASLVVIYQDTGSAACEIIVTDGNDLLNSVGEVIDNALPVTCGNGVAASLTFLGADGQTGVHGYAPDEQLWNGSPLTANHDAWNASDPDASGSEPDLGWDTDGYAITTEGANVASIEMPALGGPGDCVNWIATVIEVGVQTCLSAPGGCCFPDGTCLYVPAEECGAMGGEPQGPESACDPNLCAQPELACCSPDGHCEVLTVERCEAAGGTPQGPGSVCDPNPCTQPPVGCCFEDGYCEYVNAGDCVAMGGTPLEFGTTCDPNPCPQPPPDGACCFPDGSCQVLSDERCTAAGGAMWIEGANCDPNPCPPVPVHNSTWGRIKSLYR